MSNFYHFLRDNKLDNVGHAFLGGGNLNIVGWLRDHYHRQLAFVIIVKNTG